MKHPMKILEPTTSEIRIASAAAILYLLNILLLPFIAFVLLLVLYQRQRHNVSTLVQCHLIQAMRASICAGLMLILVSIGILLFGNLHEVSTWIIFILYVLCVHSVFILFGVFALTKALSGKLYFYPLIGKSTTHGAHDGS
ncbi:hypothetical protein [Undibacterium fentianense]|uniref:DUF4870 domain-containing protein n=1 Tax=Undibacterium fentianense TaxID=2828728 RepID=A0A941DXX7_9BURK|nr:hypothetical protein [Undibacterium fentianense]MBR7799479.1 hypothetical protein [Undibacterium fentianense]